jgi:hypothetical protein
VVPFHLRHSQEIGNEVGAAGQQGETGGFFVFVDVPAFEKARAVHRREPTADAAEAPE